MKSILVFLTLIFLTSLCSSQIKEYNFQKNKINYTDSVLFYLNKSKTNNGIDTAAFIKTINSIKNVQTDEKSVNQIESAAEIFHDKTYIRNYNTIIAELFYRMLSSEDYYHAIDYGKRKIERFESSQIPYERNLFIYMLTDLRIPYRVTDKLNDGFDYYAQKLKTYLQRNDSLAVSTCYYVLGGFYRTNGLFDLSIYYYKKSLIYINNTESRVDSMDANQWANNTAVIGQLYNYTDDYEDALIYLRSARNKIKNSKIDRPNLAYIQFNMAYALLMLGQMDSVPDLLNESIAFSKDINEVTNLANAYQVKGIYFYKINGLDSAEYYLNLCILIKNNFNIPPSSTAGILIPNYYLALCRIQQNRFKDAAGLINQEIPQLINLRNEVIKENKLLVEIYLGMSEIKKANEAFKLYTSLEEQLKEDEHKNRKLSFETEQKIANAESTISNLVSEKKVASVTRNYLIGIVSLLLLIAIGFYKQFLTKKKANNILESKNKLILIEKENVEKEKERSESLLLNILPSEVADELKHTGTAKAKAYTLATVMFTDFKDFTNLSEKISAELLVEEIHTCFSAFDNIIQKYKIEKIKTIGDSYMCASGLPVPNYTHATDMLQAAFEIRDFMQNRKKEKEARGEIPFVLRIGIHTGPVVAGIVGIKKFAYDIWGDTVNIASRMESSGEAGKVNISGSTFELVKEKFNCTYRGKIQAKNKGEIDMYFAEKHVAVLN